MSFDSFNQYPNFHVGFLETKKEKQEYFSDHRPQNRALLWLNKLSIFPVNPDHWETVSYTILKSYTNLISVFGMSSNLNNNYENVTANDKKLIDTIQADIGRTQQNLNYFNVSNDEKQLIIKRIERILFIFAKINTNFGYIQGFNELIIPIFYVMYNDIPLFFNDIEIVEAVSFEAFQFLLISSDLSNFYSFNDQSCQHMMSKFDKILNRFLPKISKRLKLMNILSIQFSFKWFNIMFAQEHELPDLLIIWDYILDHLNNLAKYEFCIGIARLQTVEKELEKKFNFSNNTGHNLGLILTTLHNIKIDNVKDLLQKANHYFQIEANGKRIPFLSKIKLNKMKPNSLL